MVGSGESSKKNGSPEQSKGHILVVDDVDTNVALLCLLLERKGFSVEKAGSGRESLQKLKAGAFDLVLLDIRMPEMNGIEVLQEVRRSQSPYELPIIMATANSRSEDIVEALALGANDYITKPIDFAALLARINVQLDLKSTHEKNESLMKELKEKNNFIKSLFGRFLSDSIVKQLIEIPDSAELITEMRDVSILFSDLRNFSSITEFIEPQRIVTLLNHYLGPMSDIVASHGGTVNEFYGDGLLAFFGAPTPQEDHAERAVRCAKAMCEALPEINRRNTEENLPNLNIGIAVHSGDVAVGNIGSKTRFKYGIVGSSVNVAARIQKCAEKNGIVITESCYGRLQDDITVGPSRSVMIAGFKSQVMLRDIRVA